MISLLPGLQVIARLPGATQPSEGVRGLATAAVEGTFKRGDGSTFVEREEITYRVDEGIPLRSVRYADGVETLRIEILELTFTSEG